MNDNFLVIVRPVLRPLLAGLPQDFVEEAMSKDQELDLWPAIA